MPLWKQEQTALARCGAIRDEDNNQLNRSKSYRLDVLIKGALQPGTMCSMELLPGVGGAGS